MKHPVPSYAASIWVVGDNLMVAFPGQGPEDIGHTIVLPIHEAGLKTVINVLKDRAKARDLRIGNRGTPTQWQAENDARWQALLRAASTDRKERERTRREAEAWLKELGL